MYPAMICFVALKIMFLRFIHVLVVDAVSSFTQVSSIHWNASTKNSLILYLSGIWAISSVCLFFTSTNCTATNILVLCTGAHIYHFLQGVSRKQGSWDYLRDSTNCFLRWLYKFIFPPAMSKSSDCFKPLPMLSLGVF